MTSQNIPVVDLRDWNAGGEARKRFVKTVGESLADIGFFAVANHGVSDELTRSAYRVAKAFFSQPAATKAGYTKPGTMGQRFFHQRCGVDKHLHVLRGLRGQPSRQCLQPALDDIMIVTPQGIG